MLSLIWPLPNNYTPLNNETPRTLIIIRAIFRVFSIITPFLFRRTDNRNIEDTDNIEGDNRNTRNENNLDENQPSTDSYHFGIQGTLSPHLTELINKAYKKVFQNLSGVHQNSGQILLSRKLLPENPIERAKWLQTLSKLDPFNKNQFSWDGYKFISYLAYFKENNIPVGDIFAQLLTSNGLEKKSIPLLLTKEIHSILYPFRLDELTKKWLIIYGTDMPPHLVREFRDLILFADYRLELYKAVKTTIQLLKE